LEHGKKEYTKTPPGRSLQVPNGIQQNWTNFIKIGSKTPRGSPGRAAPEHAKVSPWNHGKHAARLPVVPGRAS